MHSPIEILKLDESSISNPKSETSNWTANYRRRFPSNLRFRISGLRWRIRPISKFSLFFLILLPIPTLSAQERDPLVGTWRLDLAESTFPSGPPPYVRVTCKIDSWEDGLKVTYDMVGERGGVTHWEWTGKVDGKDYPLQGIEEVVTNAYSRTGDHAYEVVAKMDGRVTSKTRIMLSLEGKVMTVTSTVSNARGHSVVNTAVYKKR